MAPRPRSRPDGDNLVVKGLTKSFSGTNVLDDVEFRLAYGEVHGLLGQNGSGKSTLIKCLNGIYEPDAGELSVGGRRLSFPLPAGEFQSLGLSFVHQDLGLIPELSVLENLRLVELSNSHSWSINWRRERRQARTMLESYGLELDPDRLLSSVNPTEQALLAIVRAVEAVRRSDQPGVLVLDEPTVFLPREGVERLFQLVREVAAQGTSVLFVSHDIDEVRELTDNVTVLRDGRLAGTRPTAECDERILVEMIVGSTLRRAEERSGKAPRSEVVYEARVDGAGLSDVSVEIRRGEIVGVTGLAGCGSDDLPYVLFGARSDATGTVRRGTEELNLEHSEPQTMLRAGVALVPGDRKRDGAAMDLSVGENIGMQVLDDFRPWALRRKAMDTTADALVRDYDVRPADRGAIYGSLSGGNQQKALMAKWLQTSPDVLLLHEPTQGVDVGAREQIFALLRSAADSGMAVLCASSDAEQLARLCSRVLILARGRVAAELTEEAITKDSILEAVYRVSAAPTLSH